MISYIQAIDVIRAFAIQHLQVKKFNYEFKEQMQNLATLNEAYPFLYVVPIGASVQEFTNEFDLDIYCVDRLQKDRTNTSFIVSDTQQILADLTLWLEQGQNDIEVIQNYAMTPINNDLLDYVSGWVMRVRIQVTRIGLCEIPFGGESPTPPTCPSGIVKNSDETYTEIVPSGGTLILDDITVTDSDGTEIQVPAQTDFVCTPCDPPTEIDVYINRELVAENATEDVRLGLVDQDGNMLTFTQVDDTLTVNIPPCEDATVENSDSSYSDTISSGGTLVLPDITVTDSDGSTYTQPAVTDVVCTIPDPCEDATLTLNGNTFISVPSGDVQNLELLDQNGDPITPDDVTGNVITVDIPTGGTNSAPLMKTGQTTSYRTGDDGDIQAGRDNSFFVLDHNNFFGNTNRFTDVLGGQIYATKIALDWSTYNSNTGDVLGYYYGDIVTARNWNDSIDYWLTFSILGFNAWRLANANELMNLCNYNSGSWLNYAPFNYALGLTTSTSVSSTNFCLLVPQTPTLQSAAKSGAYRSWATRIFNISEL